MADVIIFTPQRGWTINGAVLPGGKAYFLETATSDPVTVYADAALTTTLAQPVLADANGVFPQVYFDGSVNVRCIIRDASDVEVSDIDPVATVSLSSSGASGITFAATDDIPSANVQAAIERVQANWTNAKTGLDDGVVSGTAGANTSLGQFNADGDLIGTNWTIPASVTAGDIFYASAANEVVSLAKGASLQTLRMNAGATAPEWGYQSAFVDLGTIDTTTGTSASLTGLVLTGFKKIRLTYNGISGATGLGLSINSITASDSLGTGAEVCYGSAEIDLASGIFRSSAQTSGDNAAVYHGPSGLSAASTSITVETSTSTFDGGSIKVEGIR
jgi:hypothetical protein